MTESYSGGYERGKRSHSHPNDDLLQEEEEEEEFVLKEGEKMVKRDVRSVKKFIEVALVLDKAMFDKRPHSSRKDVIHDAIQVVNIADLVSGLERENWVHFLILLVSLQYFKNSLNTRLSLVYVETWQEQDQAPGFSRQRNIQQAMINFSDYAGRKLYTVDKDTTQLLT